MAESDNTREFTCVECGRDIISFGYQPCDEKLCGACIHMPAWFTIPEIRERLAPDHDGKEKSLG